MVKIYYFAVVLTDGEGAERAVSVMKRVLFHFVPTPRGTQHIQSVPSTVNFVFFFNGKPLRGGYFVSRAFLSILDITWRQRLA